MPPELQDFIQQSNYSLELIVKEIGSLGVDESYKKGNYI